MKGQISFSDFLKAEAEVNHKRRNGATCSITAQTRKASHDATDKVSLSNRVLAVLRGKTLTAREIAQEMHKRGFIPFPERAVIQPRITELVQAEKIEVVGKKRDEVMQRTVAAYRVV